MDQNAGNKSGDTKTPPADIQPQAAKPERRLDGVFSKAPGLKKAFQEVRREFPELLERESVAQLVWALYLNDPKAWVGERLPDPPSREEIQQIWRLPNLSLLDFAVQHKSVNVLEVGRLATADVLRANERQQIVYSQELLLRAVCRRAREMRTTQVQTYPFWPILAKAWKTVSRQSITQDFRRLDFRRKQSRAFAPAVTQCLILVLDLA